MVGPVYNWTGFYIGSNGDYGWGRANTMIAPLASAFPTTAFAPFHQIDGGPGGGQIGYNRQLDPRWVIGFEADIHATGQQSSAALTTVGPSFGASSSGLPNPFPRPDFNAIATPAAGARRVQYSAAMDRNYLRGRLGDRINAVLSAAGYTSVCSFDRSQSSCAS